MTGRRELLKHFGVGVFIAPIIGGLKRTTLKVAKLRPTVFARATPCHKWVAISEVTSITFPSRDE